MTTLLHSQNLEIGFEKDNPLFYVDKLEICKGDTIALIGLNGAGKSSLLKTLSGYMPSLKGTVMLDQQDIHTMIPREISKKVSMVFSQNAFPGYTTVRDFISFGRYPHMGWLKKIKPDDIERIDFVIEKCQLSTLADRYVRELSDGEKQRTIIARSVVQDVKVCMMDEPVAHLDTVNRNSILELIKSQNAWDSVVFSTHHLEDTLHTCNKYWLIHNGTFQTLNRDELLNSAYFKSTFKHVEITKDDNSLGIHYKIT